MIKGKNAQHIILNENQMTTLISSSIRNLMHLDIQSGEKVHNNFLITVVLDCVIPEIFPQHSVESVEAEDYEQDDVYDSHVVTPLKPFGVSMFRINNKDTSEKLWGLDLVVNQKNVGDFVQALAEIESEWMEFDSEDEEVKEPSKDAVLVTGNETIN